VNSARRRGTPYEQVVEEIAKAMDPSSKVERGQWVEGPDGLRELDVRIIGAFEGEVRKILIECKDYDPGSTGRVGIGEVDALESKRRDLGFQRSAICSNAGFTGGALRKANRTGIGLISALKEGDERIRFSVDVELYTRQIEVENLSIGLNGPQPISLDGVQFEEILYDGIPVGNWVIQRAMVVIASNAIVAGEYTATHPLTENLMFEIPAGHVEASQVDFHLKISGAWYKQDVTLDATAGVYDWLRKTVRIAPGPNQFSIKDVDVHTGALVSSPPQSELDHMKDLEPGEVVTKLLLVSGLEPREPVPDISKYIAPDDLDPTIGSLPAEAYTSVGA
jgi:hypothetical protein